MSGEDSGTCHPLPGVWVHLAPAFPQESAGQGMGCACPEEVTVSEHGYLVLQERHAGPSHEEPTSADSHGSAAGDPELQRSTQPDRDLAHSPVRS